MGGCNVLLPVCEAVFFLSLLCLRCALWVGDFQVAIGGGFWVAIGANVQIIEKYDLSHLNDEKAKVILS